MRLTAPAFAAAMLAFAVPASAQLKSVGPIGPYGYPTYYEDQNGLALAHCVEKDDALCLLDALPNPSADLNVATGNFYGESFYFAADATMPTAAGQALLVLAIEGVWDNANEAVIDGDQLVFSRIRIRVDTPNAGTFKVIHPYGEDTFAAGGGDRAINFTADCLHTVPATCSVATGTQFTTPLDPQISRISHYLRWTSGAPAGYVGDPAVLHAVTGSPTGFNKFRVEGPNIGGPGVNAVETDLFALMGRITTVAPPPPVCGNGAQEEGEQCDDGNLAPGDGCDGSCQLEVPPPPPGPVCGNGAQEEGEQCDDGNLVAGDGCDGACQLEPAGSVSLSNPRWNKKKQQLSVSGSVSPASVGARLFVGPANANGRVCDGVFVADLTPSASGSISYKSDAGAFPSKPAEVCVETDANVAASRALR